MVETGLSPAGALLAATSNAAALCRVDDRLGTIEPGRLADLVVYRDDPLQDVTVFDPPGARRQGRGPGRRRGLSVSP